jgi:hypothetical protein
MIACPRCLGSRIQELCNLPCLACDGTGKVTEAHGIRLRLRDVQVALDMLDRVLGDLRLSVGEIEGMLEEKKERGAA